MARSSALPPPRADEVDDLRDDPADHDDRGNRDGHEHEPAHHEHVVEHVAPIDPEQKARMRVALVQRAAVGLRDR